MRPWLDDGPRPDHGGGMNTGGMLNGRVKPGDYAGHCRPGLRGTHNGPLSAVIEVSRDQQATGSRCFGKLERPPARYEREILRAGELKRCHFTQNALAIPLERSLQEGRHLFNTHQTSMPSGP